MKSGDDYMSASKPQIDWDDPAARDRLVDARAKDADACLAVLDGHKLAEKVGEAARLLATVVGQDLEQDDSATFRIARKVAKDPVISTVDPEARHGHKTQARSFDGYKGHVAVDPDTEIITDTAVTPGNAGDGSVAEDLISDLLEGAPSVLDDSPETTPSDGQVVNSAEAVDGDTRDEDASPTVYGDNAYGTGDFQSRLEDEGIGSRGKTQSQGGTQHRRRSERGSARPSPSPPEAPRLARRLPGHPTQGRAQDRPPHAAQARRTQGPGARSGEGRRRLPPPRRRRQPGAARYSRRVLSTQRMERGWGLRTPEGPAAPALDVPGMIEPVAVHCSPVRRFEQLGSRAPAQPPPSGKSPARTPHKTPAT